MIMMQYERAGESTREQNSRSVLFMLGVRYTGKMERF